MKKIKQKISAIIHAGTNTLMDHDPQKRICVGVNFMSLSIASLNLTIGILVYVVTLKMLVITGVLVETILLCIPILLNYFKSYKLASLSIYLIMSAATFYFGCILGRSVEAQLMVVYLIGVSLFMFSEMRIRVICITTAFLILVLLEQNTRYEFIRPVQTTEQVQIIMRWLAYLAIIILVIVTFNLYWKNNRLLLTRIQENARQTELSFKREEKENQTKDKFISNATHEIKVSFYSIFSIINILYKVENKHAVKDLKKSIDDLRAACRISQSIIDNILTYEKYKAGLNNIIRSQLIDIRVLASNLIDVYKYLADEREVKIDLMVSKKISRHFIGDEMKIRHIITNLLHNAIKFTRHGSDISIRFETEGDNLLLYVQDQGNGIMNENVEAIFEPFVTQNPDGLGLGLYIVKELVSSLNGKISVTSDSNTGTLFVTSLPLYSTDEQVPSETSLAYG